MKESQIEIGKTYCNKNGSSARKVVAIGNKGMARPVWYGYPSEKPAADALVVEYEQVRGHKGRRNVAFLASFAAWANREDESAPETVAELKARVAELKAELAAIKGAV